MTSVASLASGTPALMHHRHLWRAGVGADPTLDRIAIITSDELEDLEEGRREHAVPRLPPRDRPPPALQIGLEVCRAHHPAGGIIGEALGDGAEKGTLVVLGRGARCSRRERARQEPSDGSVARRERTGQGAAVPSGGMAPGGAAGRALGGGEGGGDLLRAPLGPARGPPPWPPPRSRSSVSHDDRPPSTTTKRVASSPPSSMARSAPFPSSRSSGI